MHVPKKWKIIIAILIFVNIVVVLVSLFNKKVSGPPQLTSLSEIEPGKTQIEQVQNIPNKYHELSTTGGQKIYFGNNIPRQYSEIITKDTTIIAYKKTNPRDFEFTLLTNYFGKYGDTPWAISTDGSEFGFGGYVYPSPGIIVVANPSTNEVLEEWVVEKNISPETVAYLFPSPTTGSDHQSTPIIFNNQRPPTVTPTQTSSPSPTPVETPFNWDTLQDDGT